MDLTNVSFSGFDTGIVQELLRAFIEMEQETEFIDGAFKIHPKILNGEFIAKHFACGQDDADRLLAELVDGEYLDGSRLVPLARGMGLAYEKNLPRLSRSEAEDIVRRLAAAAIDANARPDARVFVESLDVFGSYVSNKPDLGDVDVLAVISIPDDCQPADLDERDDVEEMLQFSDYVSLTGEFDSVAVEAPKIRIYTRTS